MLSGWVAIQRDLKRLEDRSNKKHFESQQVKMQTPAPRKEEPLATGKAGGELPREQFCRKGAGGQRDEQEPVCKKECQ